MDRSIWHCDEILQPGSYRSGTGSISPYAPYRGGIAGRTGAGEESGGEDSVTFDVLCSVVLEVKVFIDNQVARRVTLSDLSFDSSLDEALFTPPDERSCP